MELYFLLNSQKDTIKGTCKLLIVNFLKCILLSNLEFYVTWINWKVRTNFRPRRSIMNWWNEKWGIYEGICVCYNWRHSHRTISTELDWSVMWNCWQQCRTPTATKLIKCRLINYWWRSSVFIADSQSRTTTLHGLCRFFHIQAWIVRTTLHCRMWWKFQILFSLSNNPFVGPRQRTVSRSYWISCNSPPIDWLLYGTSAQKGY